MAAVVRCIWPKIQRNISILHRSAPIHLSRSFRTSVSSHGLEEFFPPGVLDKGELAPEVVKTGRRWRAGELRIKSNEDLQKLWYVLLKERNMLNTLRHEAKRQGVPMPSPERYHKVKKSMAAIKLVLGERERALEDLQSQVWALDIQAEEETDKTLLSTSEDFNSQSVEQQPIQRDIAAVHMTETSSTQNEQAQALHVDENKAFNGNLRPT